MACVCDRAMSHSCLVCNFVIVGFVIVGSCYGQLRSYQTIAQPKDLLERALVAL